jgi:hypothetical protein
LYSASKRHTARGDGDEVDRPTAFKHDHGVADGGVGDEIPELRAAGDGHLAARSAMWRPVGVGWGAVADIGRLRLRPRASTRQAMVLRRARYVAGSNGGAEAAVDELGFGCVDVSGAVLRPEAVTNSAGAEGFAFVVADGHGAGSGASTTKFAGSLQ